MNENLSDALSKYPRPKKPMGSMSAYYLWHGSLETRISATRSWIKALQVYLQELDDERKR